MNLLETSLVENRVTQNFVKRKVSTPENSLLPNTPNHLFRQLKESIGSYRDLKRITGVEISTLESWCVAAPLDQVRTLLRLLSAVPEDQRQALVESATLAFPCLDHRFLTGDKMTLAVLRQIAAKESGITFIQSESDYLRTFLATAILNSAVKQKFRVFGYDVHRPDWFVAVEGVSYLSLPENELRRREATDEKLQIPSQTQVVFLNGLWAFFDTHRKADFLKSAENCHLLLCDRAKAFDRVLAQGATHILTAARNSALPVGADDAQQMRVAIEQLR